MLNKSILLNIHIAKNDMRTLLGLTLSFMFFYVFELSIGFYPTMFLLLLALLCYFVFFIRIANKVFFTSFFDQEGIMYMTLPIPAKDMVWSKILAVSGYMTMIQLILIIGMIGGMFTAGLQADDLLSELVTDYPALDGSPLEAASYFGLLPLDTLASVLFSTSFILAIFLKFGMKRKKLLPCWIIYWVVNMLIKMGLELLLGNTAGSVWEPILRTGIHLAAFWILTRYCVKQLDEHYNV